MSDITFDMQSNSVKVHRTDVEPWKITLVDTGEKTMTGGRLKRVQEYIQNETFCFTYGDGVSNINLDHLISFHKSHGKIGTMTIIRPPGRFGELELNKNSEILYFKEKPKISKGWINGGFFVMEPEFLNFIKDDSTILEKEPLVLIMNMMQLG